MDRRRLIALLAAAMTVGAQGPVLAADLPRVRLPQPRLRGAVSVEQALRARRSVRAFEAARLKLDEISQLLWAAQGVTGQGGRRTAPSAGGLYPLRLYLVAGDVEGLAPGVYRYEPQDHALVRTGGRDRRALVAAAAGQDWIGRASAILAIAANARSTTARYGARGPRYVHIEAGHVAQNVYLQAVALGLGVTDVGSFEDRNMRDILGLPAAEEPVLVLPVGRPRR